MVSALNRINFNHAKEAYVNSKYGTCLDLSIGIEFGIPWVLNFHRQGSANFGF